MRLHLTTNNAYDTVLLTHRGRIVSEWTATPAVIADLRRDGRDADQWEVQDATGLRVTPADQPERAARLADYGTRVLSVDRHGWQVTEPHVAAHRAEYWGVAWPIDLAAAALGRRTSPAKARAARVNGAKGGRPRTDRTD